MRCLWDTPEFWARSEADEMLREMPDVEPGALANSFERSAASYDGDPEMVRLIAADLRRRAEAGTRFWPGPLLIDATAESETSNGTYPLLVPPTSVAELIDDDIPW